MSIDKSRISGNRFMFAIAFYLQSSALLTAFLASITKHESWIPILAGIILCIPLIYLYRTLMVMFPDKNLLQILEDIYGSVIGKVIGISYIWYFITLSALNMSDLSEFAKITVMTETPRVVLTLLCALVVVWAVRQGLKVVARYGPLFTIIEFIIVAVSIVLIFNQMQFTNLLPVFTQPVIKYIQGIHIIMMIPFGELVIFLMITPGIKRLSPRELTKYWFWGVAMGAAILLIVMLRDILVLGNTLHLFALPGLVTLRLVNLGEALSRMEILFAIALMMLLLFKITFLCYVSTIAIAQIFKITAYKHLALIVAIFIMIYGFTLYPNAVEHSNSARTVEPFIWLLFELIFPLLTFIIAKLRKLPKPAEAAVKNQEV